MGKSKNDPGRFCNICGNVTLPDRQANIGPAVSKLFSPLPTFDVTDPQLLTTIYY